MSGYEVAKRAMDVVLSAVGLAACSPLLVGIAGAIRWRMGSPVLFRQGRIGRGHREFTILKFRTMREPRPGEARVGSDTDRVTPLGEWLRTTSLDELPTLWNVLRGEMSLVGPRPLLARYRDRYEPWQRRRHEIRPGITGWAQIQGRNNLSWEEKFGRDVWYVDHRSLRLDVEILAKTLWQVVSAEGVNRSDEATMPEFRGDRAPEVEEVQQVS